MNIGHVLACFNVTDAAKIVPFGNSTWYIENTYILKKIFDFNSLKQNIELAKLIREQNIPVAEYMSSKEGQLYVESLGSHYILTRKINGTHIDVYEGDYLTKARKIGEAAGSLTKALEGCTGVDFPESDCIEDLNGWIKAQHNMEHLGISEDILRYCHTFAPLYRKLPRQIIHKDLHPGNMLFNDDLQLQGIIGFDLAQVNIRVYDICYLMQSLLVGKKNPEKVNDWLKIANEIFDSYNDIVQLTDSEKQAIPFLFVWIGIMLCAWFSTAGHRTLLTSCAEGTEWFFTHRDMINFA